MNEDETVPKVVNGYTIKESIDIAGVTFMLGHNKDAAPEKAYVIWQTIDGSGIYTDEQYEAYHGHAAQVLLDRAAQAATK